MDDQFLHDVRRQPRPEFAAALHARLERTGSGRARGPALLSS